RTRPVPNIRYSISLRSMGSGCHRRLARLAISGLLGSTVPDLPPAIDQTAVAYGCQADSVVLSRSVVLPRAPCLRGGFCSARQAMRLKETKTREAWAPVSLP